MKRWDALIKLLRTIDTGQPMRVAEIGVKSGVTSRRLLSAFPQLYLIAVDPWAPTDDYSHWPDDHHAVHEQRFDDHVMQRFGDRVAKIKTLSSDAAPKVADGSLDLVFIDGDHSYEGCRSDIELWTPKVRAGGFVTGHDYDNRDANGRSQFPGVDRAVREAFGDDFKTGADHVWFKRL